ncbi:MAG: hypothetical protein RBR97_07180 [Bacteroidales bacterium]|nr:hypothetical protein [Bacteroidales bacterium]
MNKAILMSIQPKWLAKILNGDKTIDIRKTMPKCELPIDVYLYCTKGTLYFNSYENEWETSKVDRKLLNPNLFHRDGKVVAKFTLNKCYELEFEGEDWNTYYWKNTIISGSQLEKKSCLTQCDMEDYAGDKNIYAWHIDNLVTFEPMELGQFYKFKYRTEFEERYTPIKQAPQSWQYAYVKGKV